MKRNSIFKSILLSATVSAILAGCGSSTSSTETKDSKKDGEQKEVVAKVKSTSITGKAVDGYLQFATVCLDLNQDGYCQSTEPMSATDKDGSFTLDISADIQAQESYKEAMLLVYGGKDADTGVDFNGKLLAPADSVAVNVTPITTLVAKAVQKEFKENPNLTKEQIKVKVTEKKAEVAKVFGIEVADIALDPIAVQATKPELIKHSLKIQKAVEAMAGGYGDDEKIEEVYEKLAEKLSQAQQSKGIDDLLTKTYADDATKAKDISANIEKAYDMYKGDLKKVAYVTKQDMKAVKNSQPVTIPVEIADDDWDKAYVKADLEDIGIDPSEDQINAIIEKIGEGVVPGAVFAESKKWETETDEDLKKVFIDTRKAEDKKAKEEDLKKAQNDGKINKFTAGTKLYDIDSYNGEIIYDEVIVGANSTLLKEFEFVLGSWSEMVDDSDGVEYILKDGSWIKSVYSNDHVSAINADGTLTLKNDNQQVTLLNQKDLSNQKIYIPELDMDVVMPSGAKSTYLGFKALHDEYRLDSKDHRLSTVSLDNSDERTLTLDTYIADNCKWGNFKTEDGKVCDATTQKGVMYYNQKWEIKTIDGVKILEVHNTRDETSIYSMVKDELYEGIAIKAGIQKGPYLEYNEVAMNAIKEVISNEWKPYMDSIISSGGYGSVSSDEDVNTVENKIVQNDNNNRKISK